jgi:hypothetical protein
MNGRSNGIQGCQVPVALKALFFRAPAPVIVGCMNALLLPFRKFPDLRQVSISPETIRVC